MRHGSGGLDHKKRATSKSSKWVIHLFSRSVFVATNHEIFVVSFWCGVDLDSHVRIFHGFPDWELSMEQVHAIRRQKLVPDGLLCLGWPKKKEPCEEGGVLKGYCENQGSPRSSTCVSLHIHIYIYTENICIYMYVMCVCVCVYLLYALLYVHTPIFHPCCHASLFETGRWRDSWDLVKDPNRKKTTKISFFRTENMLRIKNVQKHYMVVF